MRYAFIVRDEQGNINLSKSYLFDSSKADLATASADSPDIPWMMAEYHIPENEGRWQIVSGDNIPPEITRWKCLVEDCEMGHCSRCGHHWDPYVTEGGNVCDACIIADGAAQAEAEAAAFGGDYEMAERWREGIGEFSQRGF